MSRATLYEEQRLNWLSGVMAALLVLLLPLWSAKTSLETEQRGSISPTTTTRPASQSDIAAIGGSHGAVARVNVRLSFPFGPGLTISPGLPAPFDWVAAVQLPGQHLPCCYSFRFLQLIFEHQIAINAP